MPGFYHLRATLTLAAMFALAATLDASAAKKVSYEQAWAKCKAEIGANVPGSDTTTSAARQSAGGACMKKYGYRLKK
jgi:hypothetical protein